MKIKRLKLKPSARDKRRYFLVRASNDKVEAAILEYVGILGFARSAYMEVKEKAEGRRQKADYVIGSCLVGSLDDVRVALGMKGIEILKVSGTLKGLGVK